MREQRDLITLSIFIHKTPGYNFSSHFYTVIYSFFLRMYRFANHQEQESDQIRHYEEELVTPPIVTIDGRGTGVPIVCTAQQLVWVTIENVGLCVKIFLS